MDGTVRHLVSAIAITLVTANGAALSGTLDPCDEECRTGLVEGYRRGVSDCRHGYPGTATAFGSKEYTIAWDRGYKRGYKDCGR